VYSEAATWLLKAFEGLLDYRQLRKGRVKEIPGFRIGDSFHDGVMALKIVETHHERLQQSVDDDDYVTGNVITQMITQMLESSKNRLTAFQVWKMSQDIMGAIPPPLSLAAKRGDKPLVQTLLAAGSGDLNSKDRAGWTPLTYAAYFMHRDVVEILLAHGAIPSIRTSTMLTTQELVQMRLQMADTDSRKIFETIISLLNDPPAVSYDTIKPIRQKTDNWPSDTGRGIAVSSICKRFFANVRFYNNHQPTAVRVWDLIYDEQKR
jgi:ribosomal protein L19